MNKPTPFEQIAAEISRKQTELEKAEGDKIVLALQISGASGMEKVRLNIQAASLNGKIQGLKRTLKELRKQLANLQEKN